MIVKIPSQNIRFKPVNSTPSPSNAANSQSLTVDRFDLSPLVRITLLSLYVALTLPLPFLAEATSAPVPPSFLWVGLVLGFVLLYGVLSERVILDDQGIQVSYPKWVPLRRGWQLKWAEITALKPRSTGQGGLVYYFLSQSGQGYLLPMRVAGFARLVDRVTAQTGIETRDVKPLSQPWMYLILLVFTLLLLLMDGWTILTALSLRA
jgi:hypothetical protein